LLSPPSVPVVSWFMGSRQPSGVNAQGSVVRATTPNLTRQVSASRR
jgi:hypothetical protein